MVSRLSPSARCCHRTKRDGRRLAPRRSRRSPTRRIRARLVPIRRSAIALCFRSPPQPSRTACAGRLARKPARARRLRARRAARLRPERLFQNAERLPAYARNFERQALRSPSEVELEISELRRARTRHFGADPEEARPDPPLQRAERLPFQPIGRKGVAMPLTEGLGVQTLAPALLVTLTAGEIHLAVSRRIQRAAAFEARARRSVDAHGERHAARLHRHVGG